MTITLEAVGKKFGREWVLKGVDYEFTSGNTYAILGPNGSGKSTLIQLLAAAHTPTQGTIQYKKEEKTIPVEEVFSYLALCAPYLQLIEEFTLTELLEFHFQFKSALEGMDNKQVITLLGLEQAADKQLRFFSSGMQQRVKLALSVLSDVPLLLLDEPATNLDEAGIGWYKRLLEDHLQDRLLIISSNRPEEYDFCQHQLNVLEYK